MQLGDEVVGRVLDVVLRVAAVLQPELVGDEAGVGVEAPLDWDRDHPPAAEELAQGVERVRERLPDYAAAARERSLRFDAKPWVERHREVFERLVAG